MPSIALVIFKFNFISSLLNMNSSLDDLDLEILRVLQSNCKVTISQLAKKLGKPRTTVVNRLTKLSNQGMIKAYRAILDAKKLGFNFTVFIFLTAKRGDSGNQITLAQRILDECKRNDNIWIEEADIITGRYDIVFKIRVKNLENLTDLLIHYLPKFKDIERSETFIVLHTVDEFIPLPFQRKIYGSKKSQYKEKGCKNYP